MKVAKAEPVFPARTRDVTSTGRIYARAQAAFADWCTSAGIVNPGHEDVAQYLSVCAELRGPSPVPVHLSAIAQLFRSEGKYLDTKSEAIQAVMEPLRLAMKQQAEKKSKTR